MDDPDHTDRIIEQGKAPVRATESLTKTGQLITGLV
jgi:hypothetical protein